MSQKTYFKIQKPQNSVFTSLTEYHMQYHPLCACCGRPGDRVKPLSVAFKDKKPLGDFLWLAPDVFVSTKVMSVLSTVLPSEFIFAEPVIGGLRRESIWHLEVQKHCRTDPSHGVHQLTECECCGRKVYSTWTEGLTPSSDCEAINAFRFVEHPGMIFVSTRIVEAFLEAGLSNIEFIPSTDVKDLLSWMRPQ